MGGVHLSGPYRKIRTAPGTNQKAPFQRGPVFLVTSFDCEDPRSFKTADERLDHQYHLFKAYARSVTNDSDIFMSELCGIKSLVYASMIARAFNRVAGNNVHFNYC